ncbi:MAG: bifunctional homocysteine S-methyltransferase/methylenetetrahydrofolate reductase [Ignavibacteria bacterium]|nr:bifunctional homocysteine S-methyltransferase/methylenetetrahydrofolate reductase [Ignavibacteria bacterium]
MLDFYSLLKQKVILFDGGMGTELYRHGIFINKCFEETNLVAPELVKKVHSDYIDAGAEVIETNTFGANRFKLKRFNLQDRLYEIVYKGAKLAREVARDKVFVAGSVGPLGVQIEPLGPIAREEAQEFFAEIIRPLLDGGVDLLIFETFINIDELKQAVAAARKITNIPVIAQITIDEDGNTLTGTNPETTISELEATGADVVGINCTVGPQVMLNWLETVRPLTSLPISVMPNAGKPKNIDGRNIYLASPEYFAEYAKLFVKSGANIIGGCCGTTPEHIKKMSIALLAVQPKISFQKIEKIVVKEEHKVKPIEKKDKSRLARRLSSGNFVKFVELLSPRGVDASKEISKARELYFNGIDVINIPDGPRASARMSALALAVKIQREVGIETVLHFVCRDRNVIGIQSDLLGAYALGIRNILAITGDPPKLGTYPDATGVFDVDSIGLVNILHRLNNGLDIAGYPIGEPTGFFIGVGVNPLAVNLDEELRRLYWKVDAGAEFIVTQPIFDIVGFKSFLKHIEHYNLPIIVGIWPLTSLRNAEFMKNEVPGVVVPDEIIERMRRVSDSKEESLKEGIKIAREIIEEIGNLVQGVQISAPFGKIELVMETLQGFDF